MMPTRRHRDDQSQNDSSGDDSDIQEIAIIMPGERGSKSVSSSVHHGQASPLLKRRKSSPQMDPIPTYAQPTSQNITTTTMPTLDQLARNDPFGEYTQSAAISDAYPLSHQSSLYEPTPVYSHNEHHHHNQYNHHYRPAYSTSSSSSTTSPTHKRSRYSHNSSDDYVPSSRPSSNVIGCDDTINSATNYVSHPAPSRPPIPPRSKSSSTPRPVSSALAQAVNRRRDSLAQQQKEQQQKRERATLLSRGDATKSVAAYYDKLPASTEYAERPVMWSPKAPSQIDPTPKSGKSPSKEDKASDKDAISVEDYSKFQSVRQPKQRVAHKPTVPKNKQNRPKVPQGTSRKVPLSFRAKYLDVIINEYLSTGHEEELSYQEGLKEEWALAERASSKSIYVNLVAGLKKKIREKAGISTLPQDDDPKFVNGNKVVSHEEILTGKVRGTFSIERKRKLSDPSDLNEQELYDRLSRYLMPQDQLVAYGYPYRDPDNPKLRMAPLGKDGQKLTLRAELASSYTCERCAKSYRVGEDGYPLTTNKCIFHPGHLWNERINRSLEKRYSCCKGDPASGGCSSNPYHVHKGELELENYTGYVETEQKDEREPNKHGIFALDCEMSHTTYGLELTRVTVINYKNDVVYEKLVKPKNPILDYNTKYSGIKPGDLDHVDTTLGDVQRDLLKKFSSKSILVGHSLDSDMRALKIFHKHFIDTAQLFPHKRGLPYKRALRTLMVENLQVIIQDDAGHDSKEDACAALRLVMWKAKTDVPAKST